jgi:hypothetical protein
MPRPPANSRAYKDLTFQQLRSFCETARLGSMSAAAKEIGLTHPAVREQVLTLERDFGVSLIEGIAAAAASPRKGACSPKSQCRSLPRPARSVGASNSHTQQPTSG